MANQQCSNCNNPLEQGAGFCEECGTQVVAQPQPGAPVYTQPQPGVPPYNQTQPGVPPYNQGQPGVPPYNQTQPGVPPYNQTQPGVPPYNQGGYYPPNIYDTQQVRMLVNNNADKYIRKFNDIHTRNLTSSWNWCAFLFTPWWMLYRGMKDKPLTWILAANSVIAGVTSPFFPLFSALLSWVGFGFGIYVGIKGNIWFKQQIDEKIAKQNAQYPQQ